MFRSKSYVIKILDLAQEQTGQNDKILLFRPLAAAIKTRTDQIIQVKYVKEGYRIFLFSFNGVANTDHTFMEELVINTQLDFLKKQDLLLCCIAMDGEVSIKMEVAVVAYNYFLQRQRKVYGVTIYNDYLPEKVLVLVDNGVQVFFGDIEPTLDKTFWYLREYDHLTARELAEHEDITINNASLWLKRLYNHRLILRDQDDDYLLGKQHIYYLP